MPELLDLWPDAVGPGIARFAWPARIARDGTVHVHTTDSVWAFELTHQARAIAERLDVGALRFAAGPLPEAAEAPSTTTAAPLTEPTPAERSQAAAIAGVVHDPDLR